MNETSIIDMIKELKNYHRNNKDLLPYYVQKRLDDSVKAYYAEIRRALSELTSKESLYSIKTTLRNL